MNGKEKCRALKEIRQQIADNNDIPYAVSQCTHKGDCKGTCPKCEAELRYLEKELEKKKKLGKAVAVAGISVGLCSSLTACSPKEAADALFFLYSQSQPVKTQPGHMVELEGETEYIPPTEIDGDIRYDPGDDLAGDVEYIPDDTLSGDVPYTPSDPDIQGGLIYDPD